jgi:hypothetical protein
VGAPHRTRAVRKTTREQHPRTQTFYDVALPRLEDAARYLERLPLDALPNDARRLLLLCYSLTNVSFPVEAWHQPQYPTEARRRSKSLSNRTSDSSNRERHRHGGRGSVQMAGVSLCSRRPNIDDILILT